MENRKEKIWEIDKKSKFLNTAWKFYEDDIIQGMSLFFSLFCSVGCVVLFGLDGEFLKKHIVLACYGLLSLALIVLLAIAVVLFVVIRNIVLRIKRIKILQYLPITKEEFEKIGCKTRCDVIAFLYVYKFFLLFKRVENFAYPKEFIKEIDNTINYFDNLGKNRLYYERENYSHYYDDLTEISYIKIRPYISKELLKWYDAKFVKIHHTSVEDYIKDNHIKIEKEVD